MIPDTAEMRGTVRTFNPVTRQRLAERIPQIIAGVAKGLGASADVRYELRYPSAHNDPAVTALVKSVAEEVVGPENVQVPDPQMGAEDFAYFLQERPGCFFFVGTKNEDKGFIWGHHHPRFDIDEDGMAIGMETMSRSVMKYLGDGVES